MLLEQNTYNEQLSGKIHIRLHRLMLGTVYCLLLGPHLKIHKYHFFAKILNKYL